MCWGGAVLLAPPSVLPALAPGGCTYGDAVRITPLARQTPTTPTVLIARLYNVLPDPPFRPHACRCSGVGSYTVVLPRRILVALPSSSEAGATGGTAAELVLPATFEARIEVVSSSRCAQQLRCSCISW